MKQLRVFFSLATLVAAATLAGCGQGGPARTPVTGTVTANGQPVTGGSLTFAPVTSETNAQSSPVVAAVKPDGTFEVNGGAVAGKHKVMYEPPSVSYEAPQWDGRGTPPEPPQNPYAGMKPKQPEVEIAAGSNNLTVELAPGGV